MCEPSENWMRDVLEALVPARGGTFLDVGVNLGQTLLFLKSVSPATRYVGVEPNPLCVAYAERMAELNSIEDFLIIPVGVGREPGILQLQLFHGKSVDSSASIIADFRPDQPVSHKMCVPIFPYSDVEKAAQLRDLGIVKIDVEGAEAEVIESMADAIRAHSPWILVEILPCYSSENLQRLNHQMVIEALLQSLNYDILRILKNPDGSLDRFQLVQEIGIHGDISLSDYLLCPKSARASLKDCVTVDGWNGLTVHPSH